MMVFLFIGFLTARLLRERPSFYIEIPPLRCPSSGQYFYQDLCEGEVVFSGDFALVAFGKRLNLVR